MKRSPHVVAVLTLVVASACGRSVDAPSASTPARTQSASMDRALCLAPTTGTSPVDVLLTERMRAVEALPGKMDNLILLGRAWVEKARNSGDPGFYLHADACAKEVLTHEPDNVLALNLRGLALMNDHRFAEARDLAQKMLDKDHDDIMARGTLSDALLELGDIPGAERALQEMMDRKPALPSYSRASYLKWLRGDEAGAIEAIRLAYDAGRGQKDPEPSAWVLSEAANIFWLRGDVDGALAGYEKSLGEKADEAPALVGKARCLIAEHKAADAVPLLERAFAQTSLVETAWWLNKAYTQLGDDVKAAHWLARAIDAGKQGDKRSLALVLATVNKDIVLAQKTIDDDNAHRGGPYADDVAALVAWRNGDAARARTLSERAVSLGTPDPRLALHRGVILAATAVDDGERAAGRVLVQKALARGQRFDPTAVALAKEVGVDAMAGAK